MKVRRFVTSLVVRVFVLVLATLAMGATISYFQITRFLSQDLTTIALARQSALADYVATDIGLALRDRLRSLELLANALPRASLASPASICPWLTERHVLDPLFPLGFAVADESGNPLVQCAQTREPGDPIVSDFADIRKALTGESVIGKPVRQPISRLPALPFSVPIKDANGRPMGVLSGIAEVAGNGFLDLRRQGRVGESGGLLLVSPRDRLFIGSTDAEMFFKPTPPDGTNLLHDSAMKGYRGSGLTVNARGVEEISAIAPVTVPGIDWFVVARWPTSEALATVRRAQSLILWQRVPLMLVITTLVMALMAWWLRPLHRAARQAERMTLGDAPLSPIPVVRDDEIGNLTNAFNRLLAKLDHQKSELARLAHHDGLTGLPNRRLFADRVQQALSRTKRSGTQLAILFLDLDGFKQINDTLGHESGDDALRQTASRLVGAIRGMDTVARLGGDEFVVLASDFGVGDEASVQRLVEKCVAAVSEPMLLSTGHPRTLGVSVGIAYSDGSQTPEALLATADRAMYAAKAKKRGFGPA